MKLEIKVDSGDNPLLMTRDMKVLINDKQLDWINSVEFKADVNEPLCILRMEGADVSIVKESVWNKIKLFIYSMWVGIKNAK